MQISHHELGNSDAFKILFVSNISCNILKVMVRFQRDSQKSSALWSSPRIQLAVNSMRTAPTENVRRKLRWHFLLQQPKSTAITRGGGGRSTANCPPNLNIESRDKSNGCDAANHRVKAGKMDKIRFTSGWSEPTIIISASAFQTGYSSLDKSKKKQISSVQNVINYHW